MIFSQCRGCELALSAPLLAVGEGILSGGCSLTRCEPRAQGVQDLEPVRERESLATRDAAYEDTLASLHRSITARSRPSSSSQDLRGLRLAAKLALRGRSRWKSARGAARANARAVGATRKDSSTSAPSSLARYCGLEPSGRRARASSEAASRVARDSRVYYPPKSGTTNARGSQRVSE